MSGVSLLRRWTILTGYQRRLSKPCRSLLTVRLSPTLSRALLTTLLVHIGKSASLSQAALSAMNIDVDTSRLLDIVSPFTTRTLKDRKGNNKENVTKVASPVSKAYIKSDFVVVETPEVLKKVRISGADQSSSLSSAASSSKKKHARSQSQPKVTVKPGLLSHFFELRVLINSPIDNPESPTVSNTSKSVIKTPVFVPLEPIKGSTTPEQVANKSATMPSRTTLSPVTASNTVKVRSTSGKENAAPKESRASKAKALNENSLVRTPSEGRMKKPVGPRKPVPTLTPEKKKKVVGNENAVSPKKPLTSITRGAGKVLGDLSNTKANPNILGNKSRNSNLQSPFTSPAQITSFFTSPETTEISVNMNIHGDSYATESVWLNRSAETTGKGQNESSFASLGKGSVKERWMDWERERERLREMDKDKIRETDDEDTNRIRRSILTVTSEPEPETDVPLETDMDATMELEFAPVIRASEELGRGLDAVEVKEDVVDAVVEVKEKEKEAEIVFGRRRESQGSRILQTLLAAEPVTVLSPQAQPGMFLIPQTLGMISH
jgi:hypothetical protein